MTLLSPSTYEELRQALQDHSSVQVIGHGSRLGTGLDVETKVNMAAISGVLELRPADLTCAVRAGTSISDLLVTLEGDALCIPITDSAGTVGGAYMSCDQPGTWRDWVIGATYMLADGTTAKSGSHAVKSVAGYDVHRFLAGTRGSLAICLELIIRVYPLSTMPPRQASSPKPVARVFDPTQIRLMKRAKAIFDPENKLNPGEWGFM